MGQEMIRIIATALPLLVMASCASPIGPQAIPSRDAPKPSAVLEVGMSSADAVRILRSRGIRETGNIQSLGRSLYFRLSANRQLCIASYTAIVKDPAKRGKIYHISIRDRHGAILWQGERLEFPLELDKL